MGSSFESPMMSGLVALLGATIHRLVVPTIPPRKVLRFF